MAFSVGELVGYLRLEGGAAFDRQIGSAKRGLDLTGESATKAGAAIGRTETKLAGAGKASGALAAESGKLRAAQLSVTAAQERYNALVAAGTGNTARLASAEAALIRSQMRLAAIRPPADPGGLAQMRSSAVSTIATLGKLGLAFGVFELALKGIELVKSGNELTTALNGVQAASQATDEQMVKVRATSIALGKDLTVPKATAVDAADAIQDLVKSGVSLDRAMVAARPALLLAGAATVSIADAARITGKVLDDFRLPGTAAGKVADTLAAAANSAGGGLMGLADAMKYAGPTARTVGVDVTMTSAGLVLLAKSGHEGTIGGTAFANMLTRLAPVSKSAKNAMAELGVSAWDAQGKFRGLPVVVDQLHKAQERLSPEQFAKQVQIAFGNRARLAVFDFAHGGAQYLDTFYKKLKAGDVQAYADTMNRGLSAAGAQLRKEFTAWAIDLNQKLAPALSKAVFWIGDSLPGAARRLGSTLQPLEQELTAVFVPAWHVLATTLGVAATGLGDVAGLLERHKGTVQVVGTVVLGMWAAYKGYTIARTAVMAVSAAMDAMSVRAYRATAAVSGVATGTATLSAGALALGGLGIALGVAAYAWQKHSAAVAASKQEVDDFTAAIRADSGALGDNTKAAVFNALQKQGAIDAAKKFGLSLSDVTEASLGNQTSLDRINAGLAEYSDQTIAAAWHSGLSAKAIIDTSTAYEKVRQAVDGTSSNVKKAVVGFHDQQAALGDTATAAQAAKAAHEALTTSLQWVVDASGNLSQVQVDASGKVNDTTEEMVKQKGAAELLKGALDALNGVAVTQEQTTNAFLDSLDSLTESVKTNGKSLNQHSAAGRKNRETMVSIIEAAKAQAQATADTAAKTTDQTSALRAGNAQLKKNEDSIRAQAAKLHLSKDATDALIRSLGKLSTLHPAPTVDADTEPANAKAAVVKAKLDALTKRRTAAVAVNDGAATPRLTAIQAQMDAIDGRVARASVQISVNRLDAGRALQDAASSAASRAASSASGGWSDQAPGPGGHTPAHADGGTIQGPGGPREDKVLMWASPGEEIIKNGPAQKHRSLLKAINAGRFANGGTVGASNASRTTTPYEYDGIYYTTAIAAENARTRAQRRKPKVAPVHIDTIVETAGKGAAYGIASYIRGQIPSVRQATHLLSVAVDDAFALKGVQAKVARIRADLEKLREKAKATSDSASTKLSEGSDPGQFGNIQQYTAYLQAKAAQNNRSTGEIKHLEGNKAIPADLLARFAADGPSAALDSFAGANRKDVTALLRASAGFDRSVTGGSRQAASIYGPAIAKDTANLKAALAQSARTETAMVGVVLKLAQIVNKPVTIKLDGKTVATTKFVHNELQGVIDELRNVLVTGKHH